ncbi:MAG: DegV family protein [Collinsella aerofaciens]
MSWALISDSSCNLRDWQPTAPHTTFAFAPLKIRVGEREFVDDLSLDVHELNCAVQAETNASSSACPSVGEWAELLNWQTRPSACRSLRACQAATMPRPPRVTWCCRRAQPSDSFG